MITVADTTPPGGWHYTQQETGYTVTALTLDVLRAELKQHRICNKLDVSDGWWDLVQAEMCMENEDFAKRFCDPGALPPADKVKALALTDLLRFFRVLREWALKKKLETVPAEEAKRRADICRECPKNVDVKGCLGCQGVVRWLGEFMSREEAEKASDLKNCGVCGCVLKLKVLLPGEVIQETTNPREEYPTHCWVPKL